MKGQVQWVGVAAGARLQRPFQGGVRNVGFNWLLLLPLDEFSFLFLFVCLFPL